MKSLNISMHNLENPKEIPNTIGCYLMNGTYIKAWDRNCVPLQSVLIKTNNLPIRVSLGTLKQGQL